MADSKVENSHGHGEGHGHTHDWAEANRTFFDKEAQNYSSKPHVAEFTSAAVRALQKKLVLSEESTSVLDYACGPGLISQEISQHVKKVVGVDISPNMVELYNESVSNHGVSPEEMQAFCVKLEGKESELDGQIFDVVLCTMAYHHFEDLNSVTRTLTYFVKPGGVLAIMDLMKPEEGQPSFIHNHPDAHHVVPHKGGFDEAEIKALFVDVAGLEKFSYAPSVEIKKDGDVKMKCFLAVGYKPDPSVTVT